MTDISPEHLATHLHKSLDELLQSMMDKTALGGEVMTHFSSADIEGVGANVLLRIMITPTLFGVPIGVHEFEGEDVNADSPPVHERERGH